ncbi:hypothetical protein TTHERM_000355868 (macronuclear) [Tetrahymena thermophila SB210]|uniref:Uncharacterized protein n=1 Tax=Tetrahymena thermophila (strain SB210) TaxID=312017 RepID=W7XCU2_TETTS|nr:hypothetical protein TTHERM_000355868 [Tetrahymena thermophila SB210]EWS75287.1 hypothetical protein TTHERM_000355868 [Tetrahymena thermophila SB210]|eukprot:XP_012652278.1 hypothetical protein TTHERM_000355868 [Tetrahymena thermophila SB210]
MIFKESLQTRLYINQRRNGLNKQAKRIGRNSKVYYSEQEQSIQRRVIFIALKINTVSPLIYIQNYEPLIPLSLIILFYYVSAKQQLISFQEQIFNQQEPELLYSKGFR